MQYIQYILPVIFIVLGIFIKTSNDPRWKTSKKMSTLLIILGVLTLVGKIILDFSKK